jgi:hypothetical protein
VRNSLLRFRKSLDLDAYIKVEEVKNKNGLVRFRFVRFSLDKASINKILQARDTDQPLSISRDLLTQLRYYALSEGENRQRKNRFQSGLTFCTCYEPISAPPEPKPENMVMRSVISLDGDIIHQIRRDCLKDPKTCLALATSHYWLINQLLNQLHIKATRWLNWFSWGLSLVIVAAMAIPYAEHLIPLNPLTLLGSFTMSWLLQEGIRRLLVFLLPLLRRWAWRQLLLRFLSPKPLDKKIAQIILRRIVP